MCTHILEIAEKLCDRIGIMIHGEMIALGTLADLRKKASGGLEDIFLSLTGGQEYSALLKNL
jgi:ABC-2 type transport system ATP-binding protein